MARIVFDDMEELKKHIIQRIKDSDATFKEISDGIGIGSNTLYVFLYRESNIRLCNFEAICRYFGVCICFEVKN